MSRETVNPSELRLPESPIPMPGDKVYWYNDSQPFEGLLVGHDEYSNPVINNYFGNQYRAECFEQIRLKDPSNRVGPNWNRLPSSGKLFKAMPDEVNKFGKILSQSIPPGPYYYELITEIWHRGFEVYLVGGTVRDVIVGNDAMDVDLVTTMPLKMLVPLIKSMYRYTPSVSGKNGYVRIGGKPGSGDPFIDLKTFSLYETGTNNAVFGADFKYDVAHRDFACNSIYYDPVNKVLVDPTGQGVSDATKKLLTIVSNPQMRNRYHQGTIAIRFFKFACRGYTCTADTIQVLGEVYVPSIYAIKQALRVSYTRTQLLSKTPKSNHEKAIDSFKEQMISHGFEEQWNQLFEPILSELLD